MNKDSEFYQYWQQFHKFFARQETREQANLYIQGLLADGVRRKNSWQLARNADQNDPQMMQRLLFSARWDQDSACQKLRDFINEQMGHHEGIITVGEYSFIRKGDKSAGIKPQWSMETTRMENCQVGVFLGYTGTDRTTLLDRRLFLPRDWCTNTERRHKAKIPDEITYQSKPELAKNMIGTAIDEGLAFRWILADSIYGNLSDFRDYIASKHKWYIVEVLSLTKVMLAQTEAAQSVEQIVSNWIDMRWQNLSVESPDAQWCYQRVISPTDHQQYQWLIARRTGTPHSYTYYLSNAPADMPLSAFVMTIARQHELSDTITHAKEATGLAQYEVRHWHSWYRHITLSMIAYAWLTMQESL